MYAYGLDSASAKQFTDGILDRLKRAYKIGVKMAFGTDVIIDLPGKNRVESNLEILKHWKVLYEISKYNHEHGTPYWPYKKGRDFLKQAKRHFRLLEEFD